MRFWQLFENMSTSDIETVRIFGEKALSRYNIDKLEFTNHFVEGVLNERNRPKIKMAELLRFFKRHAKFNGKKYFSKLDPWQQIILIDLQTDINVVVNVKEGKKENSLKFVCATIQRKKDYLHTIQQVFVIEDQAERKTHISPSGVETSMDPNDDDYEINYGKHGTVAKHRKEIGLDIKTGTRKIKEGGVGRITKQNQTADVGPDEVKKQAAKFGNTVDKDGRPPTLSKRTKGSKTNVLYNLGLAESALYKKKESLNRDLEKNVEVDLRGNADRGYVLNKIKVPTAEREQGIGTEVMQQITDRMDSEGAVIALTPVTEFGGTKSKLIDFYKRFGFVFNKGRNKDYRFRETMIRYPGSKTEITQQTEAFDTEVKWVKSPSGIEYAAKVGEAYIELTYEPIDNGVYIQFTRGNSMGVTGEGLQNKIFGAVINHMQKWVAKNKPPRIEFGAFKPNTGAFGSQDTTRSSLYRRMVQRFASQNGYEYEVEDTGNEDTFTLKRKRSGVEENFADGKKKGKSRPGRFKKAGVSCKGSVTDLRKKAKNSSGEKQKGYHFCANMKSGRKKS